MVELHITRTVKGYSPTSERRLVDERVERFASLEEAQDWLLEEYGTSKRQGMYRDKADGSVLQTGYVIGFRGEEQDRSAADGVYRYLGQDWVEFRECCVMDLSH